MLFASVLVIVGILLLIVGGEVLLRGAVGLATLLRLTPAVIGLTVVAAGTSVPELAVSGVAAYQGSTEIAVANVVGSNIFNITVILGLCALIRPFNIVGNTLSLEYPALALVTLLCVVLVQDLTISRLDGLLFVLAYVGFTAYLVYVVRKQLTKQEVDHLSEEVTELTPEKSPAQLSAYPAGRGYRVAWSRSAVYRVRCKSTGATVGLVRKTDWVDYCFRWNWIA